MPDINRLPTPPLSEDGWRCHSAEPFPNNVNNYLETPPTPPRDKPTRDRLSLQRERETNRAKQFTTRQQRSASEASEIGLQGREGARGKRNFQHRQRNSLTYSGGEEENPNDHTLIKMAYAEQQKWITVQQKTFTKWLVKCHNP